jgi:hypothetical protein
MRAQAALKKLVQHFSGCSTKEGVKQLAESYPAITNSTGRDSDFLKMLTFEMGAAFRADGYDLITRPVWHRRMR